MSGQWLVWVTWTGSQVDGQGEHRKRSELAMSEPPKAFTSREQAEAFADELRRSPGGREVDVVITPPSDMAYQAGDDGRLSEAVRARGLAGVARARAALRKDPK